MHPILDQNMCSEVRPYAIVMNFTAKAQIIYIYFFDLILIGDQNLDRRNRKNQLSIDLALIITLTFIYGNIKGIVFRDLCSYIDFNSFKELF